MPFDDDPKGEDMPMTGIIRLIQCFKCGEMKQVDEFTYSPMCCDDCMDEVYE